MRRRVLVAVCGTCLATAGLGAAPLSAGADAGAALCGFNGAGAVAPPVNYQEHPTTYTFSGALSCGSTDSTLTSGTVSALGAGTIGCFRGDHTAVLRVAWNNGRSSTMTIHFTDVLATLVGSGTVGGGEFAGQPVGVQLVFYSPEALNCAQAGIAAAQLSGSFQIGS
jgi:hypothetical protein